MPQEGLVLMMVVFFAVGVPSMAAGWLGRNLLERLGRYPSKTPAIQLSVLLKLAVLELVSFTILLAILKVLSPQPDEIEELLRQEGLVHSGVALEEISA